MSKVVNTTYPAKPNSEKKEKLKTKIKARVKVKLQKKLAKFESVLSNLQQKIFELKQDIESLNPRFNPLQSHTKQKWVDDLEVLHATVKALVEKTKLKE